jgi:uncharacterized cupredoxin-like copper-binding protein
MKNKLLVACLAVYTLAISGCGSSPKPPTKFKIEAKEFSYSPSNLTIAAGETIEIEMTNTGSVEHDFNIDKIDLKEKAVSEGSASMAHDTHGQVAPVHLSLASGKRGKIIFTPSKAGEYEIACLVSGHKEAGMVGKLIVTP